jgi:hypothetical protein
MEISVRPIRTEDDYDAALAAVDALMDAVPGTAEGDRLDVLVTLIEAYEASHWAIALRTRSRPSGSGCSRRTCGTGTWSHDWISRARIRSPLWQAGAHSADDPANFG